MHQVSAMISRIIDSGVVAVVRADTPEGALKIADASMQGGVAAIEGRKPHESGGNAARA